MFLVETKRGIVPPGELGSIVRTGVRRKLRDEANSQLEWVIKFETAFAAGQFVEAARLAAQCPDRYLRTKKTWGAFWDASTEALRAQKTGNISKRRTLPIIHYCTAILNNDIHGEYQSVLVEKPSTQMQVDFGHV